MSEVSRPRDYEKADADPRLIGALALGIAVFLLVTPFMLKALYPLASTAGGLPASLPQPPSPRLQVEPRADLDALRRAEHQQLTTYGWVDQQSRVAHMPIDQAMTLIGERGLPGWPQPPGSPQPAPH